MLVNGGMSARQQQTPNMSPEHIMGKAVLKMSLMEVQQFVEAQFTENPALSIEETTLCPACGGRLIGDFCPACGSERVQDEEKTLPDDDDWQAEVYSSAAADDEYLDPFARVATPQTLTEHLKEQARLSMDGEDLRLASFLIDMIDEDGYLREPLVDLAAEQGLSVPQLERILLEVQSLDPPGVGARDLRECLLLQLSRLSDESFEKRMAEKIVRDQWELLSRMKVEKIATSLKVSSETVPLILQFLRENTTPHPASMFRDPWENMYPRRASKTRPDVVVRQVKDALVADIVDPTSGRVSIEEMYTGLYEDAVRGKGHMSEREKAHVKEHVAKARALIEALEFRKSSLRRIIDELLSYQADFFKEGPYALKPLTRKELAARIGLHESTVCRATQDKFIRIPNGECIAFELLFDSALPIKERVRQLAAQKLSDGEIAARLTESGMPIARRTVAKYRDQLGVLPMDYRLPTVSQTSASSG